MAQHKFDLNLTVWADDGTYFPTWVQDFVEPGDEASLESCIAAWLFASAEKIAGLEVDEIKTAHLMSTEAITHIASPLDSIQSINGNVITVDFESENVESDQPE